MGEFHAQMKDGFHMEGERGFTQKERWVSRRNGTSVSQRKKDGFNAEIRVGFKA